MKRTLTLKRETLIQLTDDELAGVVGGTTTAIPTHVCPVSFGLPVCITGNICN